MERLTGSYAFTPLGAGDDDGSTSVFTIVVDVDAEPVEDALAGGTGGLLFFADFVSAFAHGVALRLSTGGGIGARACDDSQMSSLTE